jgi:AcrR family transcriptional regulator
MSEATELRPGSGAAPETAVSRGPGRPGGEESRARILEAAGQLFADRGYDGVSVRALAKRAGVNAAAINYHFGGKEGLYHAVIRKLIDDTEPKFGPMVVRLRAGVAGAGGDRAALAVVASRLVSGLLRNILSSETLHWQMPILLRESQQPSKAFATLMADRIDPVHDAIAELVGAATGHDPKSPQARLITANIMGQCMSLGAARGVIFARLGWDDYTPERIELVVDTLVPRMLAMLGLAAAPPRAEGTAE